MTIYIANTLNYLHHNDANRFMQINKEGEFKSIKNNTIVYVKLK